MDQNNPLRLFFCTLHCVILAACHSTQGHFYRVEKGDTMWRIAHTHDVEMAEIQRANPQLNIQELEVGRRIFLPSVQQIKKVPKPKLDTEQWDRPTTIKMAVKPTAPQKSEIKTNLKIGKFMWPYPGKVVSTFGKRNQKMHNGIDIQIPTSQIIRATSPGKVVYVGDQIEGYDRVVIILHDNHLFSIYAYVGDFLIQKNEEVAAGQPLAKPRGEFFHFEIRHVKTALDPKKLLN